MRPVHRHGFTLIELSIVLVIIGLIVGGVLVGRDLIKAAEIRAVVSQIEQVNTAVMTFRLKYNALAGDMANATQYWGELNADRATCFNTERTALGAATCNGDGNGRVTLWGMATGGENTSFWQHLENAGFIAQRFNGPPADANPPAHPEYFFMRTKLNSAWLSIKSANEYTLAQSHSLLPNHEYILGGYGADYLSFGPVIRPMDAYAIDSKLDDGMPTSGRVASVDEETAVAFSNCQDGATPRNYQVTNTATNRCSLSIKAAF